MVDGTSNFTSTHNPSPVSHLPICRPAWPQLGYLRGAIHGSKEEEKAESQYLSIGSTSTYYMKNGIGTGSPLAEQWETEPKDLPRQGAANEGHQPREGRT